MKMQLAIYDEDDLMVRDLSRWVRRLVARSGEHGWESLDASSLGDVWEVAAMVRDKRPYRVRLNLGMWPVWEGRLEDVGASASTSSASASSSGGGDFEVVGFGFWNALNDLLYTALWSWKSYRGFYQVSSDDLATATPGKYRMDLNNRVWIVPVSGENFAASHANDWGAMVFWAPHEGDRKIKKITFSYDVDLPTGWTARVISYDEGFASANVEHTITTSGTGTATVTLGTDKDGFIFVVSNGSLGGVYTGETEAKFAKWTNVRIWTTDSSNVYGDEIVEGLVSYVAGINPGQLSSITKLIESPGVDLTDEVYEDARVGDVAADLAGRGDSQSPPQQFEVGVGMDRIVYFRPVPSADSADRRRWAVDVADLVLERSLEPMANSVYAVYESAANGRKLRTAASTSSASIAEYGLVRQRMVPARTTSASQAGVARDGELARRAFPAPRLSRLTLLRISTREGLDGWPWEPMVGDSVEIRNLPPQLTAGVDDVAVFVIDRLEYEPLIGRFGRLSVETRNLAPSVESYLVAMIKGQRAQVAGAEGLALVGGIN